MSERMPDLEVIWEWWKTRTEEEKEEAQLIIDALADNDSTPRAWLQIMVGHYGARFVQTAIELFKSGAFQSSRGTKQ